MAATSKTLAIHCHTIEYQNYTDHKDVHGADNVQVIYDGARKLAALNPPAYPNKYPTYDFVAAGPHLYKPWHADKDTGDVPDNKYYGVITGDSASSNKVIGLPSREIQNNLWDWDPRQDKIPPFKDRDWVGYYSPKTAAEPDDKVSAFLHVNQIRDEVLETTQGNFTYSYIVHPLYYNEYEREIAHFSNQQKGLLEGNSWFQIAATVARTGQSYDYRERLKRANIKGIEIFNGFTQKRVHHPIGQDPKRAPYGFEYGEWLLDTLLDHGIYLHAIAGNDAFYSPDYSFDNIKDDPIGSVVVAVESLPDEQAQRTSLVNSLYDGVFYASSGVRLADTDWQQYIPKGTPGGHRVVLNSGDNEVIWQYSASVVSEKAGTKPYPTARTYGTLPVSKGEQVFEFGPWESFKWIRFQAIDPKDTRRRAWCQPIVGDVWESL